MILDFTRYNAIESYLFDRFIAPRVALLHDAAAAEIEPALAEGRRVLDVGCGGGQFALRLAARYPEHSLVGLDLSPEQIRRARRRATGAARPVEFVEGSALELPFAEGSFDLVYSLGSLKHWPDPARGLRECARVLRPGGRALIFEGDRGCRHEDAMALVESWGLHGPLRAAGLAFVRTLVVGRSHDLDDARALLAAAPELDGDLRRVPGTLMWRIDARRR